MTAVRISKGEVVVEDQDITEMVSHVQMQLGPTDEDNEIAIFLNTPQAGIEVEGVVTIVEPSTGPEVLRTAVEFLQTLDPVELEVAALEALTMGSPKSLTPGIVQAIVEAFEHAANELESPAEVRGGADDRHRGGEAAGDS